MIGSRAMIGRASVIPGLLVALLGAEPSVANAQGSSDCDSKVKPAPGRIGYKKRSYGCEGLFVGLQSAPLGVQVVSLVRGSIAFDTTQSLMWVSVGGDRVPSPAPVRVVGRARQANLHWALDTEVSPGKALTWDLREVIRPAELRSETIGLYGVMAPTENAPGGPVFVPLEISKAPPAPAASGNAGQSLQLIVRVPAAGQLCWSMRPHGSAAATDSSCKKINPVGGNADGYFEIEIPSTAPRAFDVILRWRPRHLNRFGNPVRLSIQRW